MLRYGVNSSYECKEMTLYQLQGCIIVIIYTVLTQKSWFPSKDVAENERILP